MDDYKCRGKRVDNGEWVYGYYVELPVTSLGMAFITGGTDFAEDTRSFIITNTPKQHPHYSNATPLCVIESERYEVDPSTVGRYTGLPDKNGVEIYEGDIVRQFGGEMWELTYTVGWNADRCGFWLYCNGRPHLDLNNERPQLEVIGNVHENPDLLEGGEQRG